MPVDYKPRNDKERFWNKIYRTSLLTLCIFGCIVAIYALMLAVKIAGQNTETNKKIDCIALFFTQDSRPDKKLENPSDISEACKIVPAK